MKLKKLLKKIKKNHHPLRTGQWIYNELYSNDKALLATYLDFKYQIFDSNSIDVDLIKNEIKNNWEEIIIPKQVVLKSNRIFYDICPDGKVLVDGDYIFYQDERFGYFVDGDYVTDVMNDTISFKVGRSQIININWTTHAVTMHSCNSNKSYVININALFENYIKVKYKFLSDDNEDVYEYDTVYQLDIDNIISYKIYPKCIKLQANTFFFIESAMSKQYE